jgi:hypothetical protein
LRIRLQTVQEEDIFQVHTIEAIPPSSELPHGRFSAVLVHVSPEAHNTGIKGEYLIAFPSLVLIFPAGYRAAEVRMFFRVNLPKDHEMNGVLLAHIHWFTAQLKQTEKPVDMYAIKRLLRVDGNPFEDVIEADSIYRLIQIIPRFATNTSDLEDETPDSLRETCRDFLINSFADKEIHLAVY